MSHRAHPQRRSASTAESSLSLVAPRDAVNAAPAAGSLAVPSSSDREPDASSRAPGPLPSVVPILPPGSPLPANPFDPPGRTQTHVRIEPIQPRFRLGTELPMQRSSRRDPPVARIDRETPRVCQRAEHTLPIVIPAEPRTSRTGEAAAARRAPAPPPLLRENNTGLPDTLKTGIERLAALSLDDVRVHYNSPHPAQVHALAYTRGTDIHIAPGQERHLPHEAWHVVQQKEGRVRPNLQLRGIGVNDDPGLEREADRQGDLAAGPGPQIDAPVSLDLAPAQRRMPEAGSILQARWADAARIPPDKQDESRLFPALISMTTLIAPGWGNVLSGLYGALRADGERKYVLMLVEGYLKGSLHDNQDHATDELANETHRLIWAYAPSLPGDNQFGDDLRMTSSYHDGDDVNPLAPEAGDQLITSPEQVIPGELRNVPNLLEIIFRNIAANSYGVTNPSEGAFWTWYNSPVAVTRNRFQQILQGTISTGSGVETYGRTDQPMQMRRTPGALSFQAGYVSSMGNQFTDVTYQLDHNGNIDFQNPVNNVPTTQWSDPVLAGSRVQLNQGATDKRKGILNNGVECMLAKAPRSRHNMIANRIKYGIGNKEPNTHTWHHENPHYHMILVDYMVHRKHGHNGGFLFWK